MKRAIIVIWGEMGNNGLKNVQGIKKEYCDNSKVHYVLYSFGNNGCFQVEWQQMAGMSVLLNKVDRCVLFSSERLLVWKMVVERRKQKEDV